MANYNIVEGENKSIYYIKESKTGHIIESFEKWSDARAFFVKLNKGHGFDGWTPAFFLKKIKKT